MARVYYGNATDAQREYIRRIIHNQLGACQSALVDMLLQRGDVDGFSWDDVKGLYPNPSDIEGADSQEVYEWWLVKDADLVDDLRHEGAPILANDYGTWWGRTCTGQNIEMDSTFWNIFQDDLL